MRKIISIFILLGVIISCNKKKDPVQLYTKVCGTIKNDAGEHLQNVDISAVLNNDKNFGPVSTDADGRFCVENLESGDYVFTFKKDGYDIAKKNLTVNINNKPEELNMTLKPKAMTLKVSNSLINFDCKTSNSQSVFISNANGQGTIDFSISVQENATNWLKVNKTTGTVKDKTDFELTISVNCQNLAYNSYSGIITIQNSNVNEKIYVNLNNQNPSAPKVEVTGKNGISQTSANLTGKITEKETSIINLVGFYYSNKNNYPNQADSFVEGFRTNNDEIIASVQGLESGKKYYVRAFAKNVNGLVGLSTNVIEFTTSTTETRPSLTIVQGLQNTEKLSFSSKIITTGGSSITLKSWGFCYNTTGNPTIQNGIKVDISPEKDSDNSFSGEIPNLKSDTEYKIRAFAINSKDSVGYSSEITVRTLAPVLTPSVSSINPNNAGFGDEIEINGANFGLDTSKVKVVFGGNKLAKIKSISSSRLIVIVPEGAKTGEIKVSVSPNGDANSKIFTYLLTPVLETIATLPTKNYINDVYGGCNGNLFFAGYQVSENAITSAGVYKVDKNNKSSTIIETASGYKNGEKATALLAYPTQVVCYNDDIYITDQFNSNQYTSQPKESFISIRKITQSGTVSEVFKKTWINNDFIHDLESIPAINGLLFADGFFTKVTIPSYEKEVLLDYEGYTSAIDLDQNSLYTLDLTPSTNSTNWTLNKRNINGLAGPTKIDSKPLLTIGLKPIGIAIDTKNQWAYVMEKDINRNKLILYKITIGVNNSREIVYEANLGLGLNDDKVLQNGSIATFNDIKCFTYDSYRNALIFVDLANGKNNVRMLYYK
ncbi:carboxypeptidase regulatory-like domain-containing protein [Emticicia sp. W12TSBA100-4]|uniref:carboxypeptidase regulatory-like domain-containing protein n=1 Tax=Emticicia sp. W12TSBA100-4 TaxID=3160965 RepID=UPI0033060661